MSVLKKAKTMLYGIIDFPLWFEWRRFFGAQALQALKAARYGSGCQISLNWRLEKRSIVSVFKSKQISRLDVEGERKVFEIRCFGLVLTFFPKIDCFLSYAYSLRERLLLKKIFFSEFFNPAA